MRIANNITALNAWRNLEKTDRMFGKSMEKLSSGFRINRAADDPAGLVLSEKFRAQITGLGQGLRNTQDAVSMIQTAEGALEEQHRLLNDMRALALHAANTGVVDSASIAADQAQIDEAVSSLDRIALNTVFAGKNLLNGSASNKATVVNTTNIANAVGGTNAPTGTNLVGVAITTAATRGTMAGSVDRSGALGANANVVVNGVSVTLTSGSTQAQVIATLNNAFSANALDVTAVANGNNIDIRHNQYGASYFVTVNDVSGVLKAAGTTTNAGVNVAGTVNGETATGDGLTLTAAAGTAYAGMKVTLTAAGNTVTTHANAVSVTRGQLTFQVGSEATDSVTSVISDMEANQLGTSSGGVGGLNNIKTGASKNLATDAKGALAVIDEAIADVSDERAKLGALQKYVLETKLNSLNVARENVQASESRVRDVDMASETTNFTKHQILMQAATAMLAQANTAPQNVLQLLRG